MKHAVCLDPGHGGKDPGALGNNLKEKDINLSVTLKIGEILKRHNIKVVYTRIIDAFIELPERANIANRANADVFVSIHCNSFTSPTAQGLETYSYPGSATGTRLAKDVHDSVVKDKLYTKDRGLKTASFAVLRETKMPATLVELGFISNAEDATILKNKQDELAHAVARGILQNLGVKYISSKVMGSGEYTVKEIEVNLNGVKKKVDAIEKDGNNYVKLQNLRDSKIEIGYDSVAKIPVVSVK